MVDTLLASLIALTAALSGAFALAMALREPCRKLAGSKTTYWIWLLVPVALVAILAPALPQPASPAPSAFVTMVAQPPLSVAAPPPQSAGILAAMAQTVHGFAPYLLAIWGGGLGIFLGGVAWLQRRYMRRLGRLTPDPARLNVFYAQRAGIGPSVVGLLPSRIILPADFSSLFEPNEQRLILAHEHTHVRERHPVAGAFGLLIVALQWFNPLAYFALSRFRIDQELACDAGVVARHPRARATYAKAMLKACVDPRFGPPLGYGWSGGLALPMPYRIALLRDGPPPPGRRSAAMFILALLASGGAAMAYVLAPHPQLGFNLGQAAAPAAVSLPEQTVPTPDPEVMAVGLNRVQPVAPRAAATEAERAEPSSVAVVPAVPSDASSSPIADLPTPDDLDPPRRRLYDALVAAAERGENVARPRLRWATGAGPRYASVQAAPAILDPLDFSDVDRVIASVGM